MFKTLRCILNQSAGEMVTKTEPIGELLAVMPSSGSPDAVRENTVLGGVPLGMHFANSAY